MRSISIKLILAFVGISLAGILLIVFLARYTTGREFQAFTVASDRSDLLAALEDYYRTRGSWGGIESVQLSGPIPYPPENPPTRREPMTITDVNGMVLRAGSDFRLGEVIPAMQLQSGALIQVDGQTIGYLIFAPQPFGQNSPEGAFLDRITQLLIYSALGTLAVSLLLGILLSRTLTHPLRELTAATQAVAGGNLSLQVPVRSKDELGQLAGSFNRMSAELSRALQLRHKMTADIAHELRTPLSLIIGHADAVHDGVLPPSLENFEIIRDEAGRLEHLVDDLRTLSLADAGELSLAPQTFAPQKVLNEILSLYQHAAQQKDIALELQANSALPDITADPGRITQVLTNILDNALRYTPGGGKVIITAQSAPDEIQISVSDSGPGLPPEELDRIFDRLYQADPFRERQEGGSGLGLAIAKSIVELHRGRIWAECDPGQGLKIVVILPIQGTM